MNRSAARSSSLVVTPGRTLPASRFIVRTRIAPAAAMRSTSSGLFLMITGCSPRGSSLDVLLEAERGDHRPDVVVNLVRRSGAVDPAQQALLVVVLDQGLGLFVIDAE